MVIQDHVDGICSSIKRYFARILDLCIYSLLCNVLLYTWGGLFPPGQYFWIYIATFLPYLVMIFLEPLLLNRFGTTVGKFVFGISVCTYNGEKLSYEEGIHRVWKVFVFGMGCNIPPLYLFFAIRSFLMAKNGRTLAWETGSMLTDKKRNWFVYAANILFFLVCSAAGWYTEVSAVLPSNRGTLSSQELEENYQRYTRFLGVQDAPELIIEEKDGVVWKVSFNVETDEEILVDNSYQAAAVSALMAYAGAQDGISYFDVKKENLLGLCGYSVYKEDFAFSIADIAVFAEIDKTGYQDDMVDVLFPVDGEETHYHLEFVMTRK